MYPLIFIKFISHLSAGYQCSGHPTVGMCEKLIKGYTFDSVFQKCMPFTAGGCSLSANGFNSERECTAACNRNPYGGKVMIQYAFIYAFKELCVFKVLE